MKYIIPYNTTQIIVKKLKERQTLWNLPSFWGLTEFFQLPQGVNWMDHHCLSNLKRSVILGHREDALFSHFQKEDLLILPLRFPFLYKEFEKVPNCLYPASTVLLFCYL